MESPRQILSPSSGRFLLPLIVPGVAVFMQDPVKHKAKNSLSRFLKALIAARPPGFEPGTAGLEILCSIQLSYERKNDLGQTDSRL